MDQSSMDGVPTGIISSSSVVCKSVQKNKKAHILRVKKNIFAVRPHILEG